MRSRRKIDLSITYVYIINSDLKMSKGKIASQVSHVSMMLADSNKRIGKAIILKAPNKTLLRLMKFPNVNFIHDAGLTQVPEGSLTCIGFLQTPFTKTMTKKLKLV